MLVGVKWRNFKTYVTTCSISCFAGSSTKSRTTDHAVAAKGKATLEGSLKSMKSKIAAAKQQKSTVSRQNIELTRKYVSPDQPQSMELPSMRGTPWFTDTTQKNFNLHSTYGYRGSSAIREFADPLQVKGHYGVVHRITSSCQAFYSPFP